MFFLHVLISEKTWMMDVHGCSDYADFPLSSIVSAVKTCLSWGEIPAPSDQWPECNMKLQFQTSLHITLCHIIPSFSMHSIRYVYAYMDVSVCVCLCIYQNEQTHLQVISISIYLSTKFNGCLVEVAWFHLFEPHLLEPNRPKVKADQLDVEIVFGMHSMGTSQLWWY